MKKNKTKNYLIYIRILISIRKNNLTLIYGFYKTLYCEENILIFERYYKDEKIIIAINNNDKQNKVGLSLNAKVKDLLNSQVLYVDKSICLDSMEFKIYKILERTKS